MCGGGSVCVCTCVCTGCSNICNSKLSLMSVGYIRTAVNQSCQGNLGTTSGQQSDETQRGCCRMNEQAEKKRERVESLGVSEQQKMTCFVMSLCIDPFFDLHL